MSKTTPFLSLSRGDRQDSSLAQGICEQRSKKRGWCRAAQPRLSPVNASSASTVIFFTFVSRGHKSRQHPVGLACRWLPLRQRQKRASDPSVALVSCSTRRAPILTREKIAIILLSFLSINLFKRNRVKTFSNGHPCFQACNAVEAIINFGPRMSGRRLA